ncbi:2738_t:CDS:2 [Funneliformis caledonium]|uniref:2738_t:CDS:1 n=1 Tax=Funneliformis caledonium TaxID=1117310 RepID=A0A9N9FL96_9GLOM|nr:2738_t:CDS:2 [Funneliformis caledonium]
MVDVIDVINHLNPKRNGVMTVIPNYSWKKVKLSDIRKGWINYQMKKGIDLNMMGYVPIEGKTSGNPKMDQLIYKSQLQTEHYYYNLDWVPYNRFQDIKLIGEGGFSKIYSATWLDGVPKFDRLKRRSEPKVVILKQIKDSNNLTNIFINEIVDEWDALLNSRLHTYKYKSEIGRDFFNADMFHLPESSSNASLHSEAIYTSRQFSFFNLPKPRNSSGVQIEIPEEAYNRLDIVQESSLNLSSEPDTG